MNRTVVRAVRIVLVLIAAGTLVPGGPADAQSAPETLGGFQGTASSSGLHAKYNPAGLLPIAAPVDLGAPDALATIASGPATFARASAADPGDLLANPDALIQLGAGSGYEAGTIPSYPYRVTASNGVGEPSDEVSPAPGLRAHVAADSNGSSAEATMPRFEAPAVVTAGSALARASTSTDGSTVTVRARTSMSDINLLGILTIDSVVTDLTAVADGKLTKLTGGTVVSGAAVMGRPVTIDESGIGDAELNELFERAGMHVAVVGPVEQGGKTAGQLTAAGLQIDFELSERTFPALGEVFDALPSFPPLVPGAPSGDDVLALAQARHLFSVHVAGASVALTARPALTFDVPVPSDPPADSPPFAAPAAPAAPSLDPAPIPASQPDSIDTPAAPVPTSTTPTASLAHGVGVLAVLSLFVQPFVGDRLARGASLLTGGGPAGACPREGS